MKYCISSSTLFPRVDISIVIDFDGSIVVTTTKFLWFFNFVWFLERFGNEKVIQFGHHFSNFDDVLAVGFLSLFCLRNFLTFWSFRLHSGSNLGRFLGYLGTLEIGLKR